MPEPGRLLLSASVIPDELGAVAIPRMVFLRRKATFLDESVQETLLEPDLLLDVNLFISQPRLPCGQLPPRVGSVPAGVNY